MDEPELTAAEAKAAYEEIKKYVKETNGLSVSSLYIAQAKQTYGIKERANYNKPKSEEATVTRCPEETEKAIAEALLYFKMIK